MVAAQTDAFNHITLGTGPGTHGSGTSFAFRNKETESRKTLGEDKESGDPSVIATSSDTETAEIATLCYENTTQTKTKHSTKTLCRKSPPAPHCPRPQYSNHHHI